MRPQAIGWLLCVHLSTVLAQVDPDLFDGRVAAKANRYANAEAQEPASAVTGPDASKSAQPKAAKEPPGNSADATQLREGATKGTVVNSVPTAHGKTNQGSEASLPEIVEAIDQSDAGVGKFARFSVGVGARSLLPEKSSKVLNRELEPLSTRGGAQSTQTATKGAQRSTDLKSVNRDRGTDLPTNL